MAVNYDKDRGVTKEVKVANTVVSGNIVRVGDLLGVAETSAALGADGSYYATVGFPGVVTVTTELASATVYQGTAIYTATAAGANNLGVLAALTTTVSTNRLVGYTLNDRTLTGKVEIRLAN
jgi:predicted RecA/RadA family phage recombinase